MKKLLASAIALAGLSLSTGANAAINITGISGDPGFRTGTIQYTGAQGTLPNNASSIAVSVGQIKLTGQDTSAGNAAVTFLSYCVDIFDYLRAGLFDAAGFSFDAGKEQKLNILMTNTAGDIAAATTLDQKINVSAAIQMAVWEIAFETGTGPFSLGGGDFQMTGAGLTGLNGGSASAMSVAQGYMANMNSGAWSAANPNYSLRMLVPQDAANNQTQVFLISSPVPEPSTWALFILGFGAVGAMMRKRPRHQIAIA